MDNAGTFVQRVPRVHGVRVSGAQDTLPRLKAGRKVRIRAVPLLCPPAPHSPSAHTRTHAHTEDQVRKPTSPYPRHDSRPFPSLRDHNRDFTLHLALPRQCPAGGRLMRQRARQGQQRLPWTPERSERPSQRCPVTLAPKHDTTARLSLSSGHQQCFHLQRHADLRGSRTCPRQRTTSTAVGCRTAGGVTARRGTSP